MLNVEETYLDEEEKVLIESLNDAGWQPVADIDKWKKTLSLTAQNTLLNDYEVAPAAAF